MNTESVTATSALEKLAAAILEGRVSLVEKRGKVSGDGYRTTEWTIVISPGITKTLTNVVRVESL